MINNQVLEKIKTEFLLSNANRNIRIPSGIKLTLVGDCIKMKLSSNAVSSNMQKDDGSFEGWAIILKRWGKYESVLICWDKPEKPDNGHYQRFLFRVKNFNKDFNSWFLIEKECKIMLQDLKIKESGDYVLNMPSKRGEKVKPKPEAILERRFVEGDLKDSLKHLTNAFELYRQLPVGVFNESVYRLNSIFTGGGSAIDIWGIDNKNELLVFELKAENNDTVGIISELYFYVCVLQNLRTKIFKHENCNKDNQCLLKIPNTKKINAFFLTQRLHPLIDKEVLNLLNNSSNKDINYQSIQFDKEYKLTINTFN